MGLGNDDLRMGGSAHNVRRHTGRDAWTVRLSLWLYRRCLLVYPPGFRAAFAVELTQVFRVCCRDAIGEGGISALAWLWLTTLADLVVSAFAERLTRGYTMTSTRISRFGGLVGLVGCTAHLTRAASGWLRRAALLARVVECLCALLLLGGNVSTTYVWDETRRFSCSNSRMTVLVKQSATPSMRQLLLAIPFWVWDWRL
ncbi:MAG: hypothetical protein ABI068_10815 [Ktedonobacterales bacterium]